MSQGPPRLATLLFRALLPSALEEEALDELSDVYDERCAQKGEAQAARWYWRQIPGFVVRLRWASLPGGVLHDASVTRPKGRGRETMATIATDLRHGARTMLRSPGFTIIAVLTLALGIGANAAIFSVVRSVLLRPLPFPEPEQLVELWESRTDRGFDRASFTHGNFWDVRELNRSLAAVGALEWTSLNLTGVDAPQRLSVGRVSTGFLRALEVRPLVGRVFVAGEDEPSADQRVVVLSHALWRTRFGSERAVVGRTLTLGGEGYRVIGVLPPGTPWLDAVDVFLPLVHVPNQGRSSFELTVIGRLRKGITIDAARADLEGIGRRIAEQYPEAKGMSVTVESSARWVASDSLRRALWVLVGAVGFLLLIACVNLANLLLARATGRTRDRALRAALGASRSRIARLELAETALLGVVGAVFGLLLAVALVRVLRAYDPGGIPRLADAQVDRWVLAVTLGTALLTSLLTGLAPALRTPYRDLVIALREGERSVVGNRRAGRLRAALVSVEVALSLILLVGAGLLIRSFSELLQVQRGFQTEHRYVFDVGMPDIRSEADDARAGQLLLDIHSRVRALPQVASAAAVSMKPLRGVGTGMGYAAADLPPPARNAIPWASWRRITSDYFRTLGVPLVAGRDFTEHDQIANPWRVIISKRIADQLWPNGDAVGKQLLLWHGQDGPKAEVIGVAGDMRDWGLDEEPSLAVYLPYYRGASPVVNFVVHSRAPASTLEPAVRAILANLDRSLPLSRVTALDEMIGVSVASRRFTMLLLAALSALALCLALAGVYGVLAYSVSRRRSEMGLRMALGASAGGVLRLVMLQGLQPVAVGLFLGLAAALALSRFMTSLLFGVTALDATTYAGVATLVAGAATLSCYLPARAALRVNALTALRDE